MQKYSWLNALDFLPWQLFLYFIVCASSGFHCQQRQDSYDLQLNLYRQEIKKAIHDFQAKQTQLESLFDDPRMSSPYREIQTQWYRTAIKVIQELN